MKNILSIDFDYFIDTDVEIRNNVFPNGLDYAPKELIAQEWDNLYHSYPELKNIGVIKDFYLLVDFLKRNKDKYNYKLGYNVFFADSHSRIKQVIDLVPLETNINITNVDFHHDYYHFFTGGQSYNCSNWLRRLLEERPFTAVKWVRRSDSETVTLSGAFPYYMTTKIKSALEKDYDYIFVCLSPEWTPPHLYYLYQELIRVLK